MYINFWNIRLKIVNSGYFWRKDLWVESWLDEVYFLF